MQLPGALREYAAGAAQIEIDAPSVDAALTQLADRFPLLRRHLFTDSGELRGFVRVYLNDEDIGDATSHPQPLRAGDTILIVPSIAGGENTTTA